MALFHAQPTLTRGSLHYRLATPGYQKRNTYGVEIFISSRDWWKYSHESMENYNLKTIKLSYVNTAYTFVLYSFDFLFPKLQRRNAMVFIPIFQWIHRSPWMLSSCNSVRVVLLIARGWRGTSLPRVNIRMEIQRHRCWAFSVKSRLQWNLLWRINPKKRNTYGVVPHTTYINPG